jgi:DNA-binding XRE family transcriptional regulator
VGDILSDFHEKDAQALQTGVDSMCPLGYNTESPPQNEAQGLQMSTLADVAAQLKAVRLAAGLTQIELARRAGVARTTVARMETVAKGDMSVSVLVRLLEAAGYELKAVKRGYARTLEDVLAEQRSGEAPT